MFVYPDRMKANLESTCGLIFSGQLLLDLVENGVSREDAYRAVQAHAMRAWREGLDFHELVLADKEIMKKVPRKQIDHAFDLQRQLRNVDKIFARIFGGARRATSNTKTPKPRVPGKPGRRARPR
jgi:adenylosuccinate lyase